jgi:hypothetical protein
MNRLTNWLKAGLRAASLGLFALLLLFWLARLFYCVAGYFENGSTGLKSALMRHMQPIPSDLNVWGHPHWDQIALRYVAIACITVLLGILNRRVLADFWHAVRHGPPKATNRL